MLLSWGGENALCVFKISRIGRRCRGLFQPGVRFPFAFGGGGEILIPDVIVIQGKMRGTMGGRHAEEISMFERPYLAVHGITHEVEPRAKVRENGSVYYPASSN